MSSAAKVGAFMLVILAILGYFVLKIEDIHLGGAEQRQVRVLFDNVAGLDERSAVRVAGVRKGTVSRIELRPDGKALATLTIDADVPLFENASARIANLGLLGEKYVELDSGDPRRQAMTGEQVV
ncbi:MAG TPA: MlaD family protein, partial [Thermoanaerobaculia bacterium]|nr:MlaD family protein [Thermoanaerobaculia bacterium]